MHRRQQNLAVNVDLDNPRKHTHESKNDKTPSKQDSQP
jgi:hypothetical protein